MARMDARATSEAPHFFVVTPTHNRAALVRRAIDSVLDQSYQDWDLFVVDDGSIDDTKRVLSQLPEDPRIHTWSFDENQGANAARNFLLERIFERKQEGFIAILDDDDCYTKDALARFAQATKDWPEQRWFVANCETAEGESLTRIPRYEVPLCYLRDHKFGNRMAGEVAHVFHTSIVGSTRFSDRIRNAEEWWFFTEIARNAPIFPLDFHATTMILLEDGLTRTQGNRDRALEIYEMKRERYGDRLSLRERTELEAKLARHRLMAGQTASGLRLLARNLLRWPFEPRLYGYFAEFIVRSISRGRLLDAKGDLGNG